MKYILLFPFLLLHLGITIHITQIAYRLTWAYDRPTRDTQHRFFSCKRSVGVWLDPKLSPSVVSPQDSCYWTILRGRQHLELELGHVISEIQIVYRSLD